MVNSTSEKFSRNQLKARAYRRIAATVQDMWEETGRSDTRLFQEPLIPDSFVIVGRSRAGGNYREHVVPRVAICEECHRMFSANQSVEEVASFISRFLRVVLISGSEANYLNSLPGLKTGMPIGWNFANGDVFARLREARIEFDLYPNCD